MGNDYRDGWSDTFPIIVGTFVKYISLLEGINSVCKDEPNLTVAMVAGFGYVVGELVQRYGAGNNTHERFSQLEKTLLKHK